MIHGLRPPVLDDLGLVAALRQCVNDAAARPDAPTIRLRVVGTPARLPPQTELTAQPDSSLSAAAGGSPVTGFGL